MIGTYSSIVSTPSGSTFLDLVLPFRRLKVCSKRCWSFSMRLPLFPIHPWPLFNKSYVYFPFAYVVGVVFIVVNLYLVLRCNIFLVHSWLACCSLYLLWSTLSIMSALVLLNLSSKRWGLHAPTPQRVCPFPSYTQTMKIRSELGQVKNKRHVFLEL